MFGRYFGLRYFAAAYFGTGPLAAPAPATYTTVERAIHARIDATPALADLVGPRHYTGGTPRPAAGPTATPYLVLDHLGILGTVRTSTRREIVDHLYQAALVGDSTAAVSTFYALWRKAFHPWMDPLRVAGLQVIACQVTDRLDDDAGEPGPSGTSRVQSIARFVVRTNEPAA